MTIILTTDLFAKLCPKAPSAINAAFVEKQHALAEILDSPKRLALAIANIYAETSGYSLAGLLENIHYTAAQMAHEWPNRFKSAAAVEEKFGTAPGWQNKAFDEIYGDRMGNRPGTHDGSTYIGRGGPQLTGLDEYTQIGKLIGVPLAQFPDRASDPDLQPDILGAYWTVKKFSQYADDGDIVRARKIWNGGTNGLDVVEAEYPRLLKIINNYSPTTAAAVVQVPTATKDETLVEYQQELIEMGYHEVGEADGLIGGKTMGAIQAFFVDRGIDTTLATYPSQTLANALNAAHQEDWHRPIAPKRAFATTEQLAPKIASVAPTQKAGMFAKLTGWFGGGGATVSAAVQFMPTAHDSAAPYLAMAHEWFDKIPGWVPMAVVGGIAVATVIQTNKANKATTADYQQGKIN